MTAYQTNHDPTAVVGRRIIAYIIDGVISFGIGMALFFATADFTEVTDVGPAGENFCDRVTDAGCVYANDNIYLFENRAVFIYYGAVFAYWVLIRVVMQGLTGATIGKLVTGIRTVNQQGTGPGIGRALVRELLWVVDAFPYCFPLVGLVAMLTTKGHRRVGDMAGGTYVVKTSDRGRPVVLPGDAGGAAMAAPAYATAVPPAPASSSGGYPAGPPAAPAQDFATPPPPAATAPSSDETSVDQGPGDSPPPSSTPVSNQTMQFNVPPSTPASTPQPDPEAGPQWDAERNAYIQYDASRGWLIFDDAAQEWKPLG